MVSEAVRFVKGEREGRRKWRSERGKGKGSERGAGAAPQSDEEQAEEVRMGREYAGRALSSAYDSGMCQSVSAGEEWPSDCRFEVVRAAVVQSGAECILAMDCTAFDAAEARGRAREEERERDYGNEDGRLGSEGRGGEGGGGAEEGGAGTALTEASDRAHSLQAERDALNQRVHQLESRVAELTSALTHSSAGRQNSTGTGAGASAGACSGVLGSGQGMHGRGDTHGYVLGDSPQQWRQRSFRRYGPYGFVKFRWEARICAGHTVPVRGRRRLNLCRLLCCVCVSSARILLGCVPVVLPP